MRFRHGRGPVTYLDDGGNVQYATPDNPLPTTGGGSPGPESVGTEELADKSVTVAKAADDLLNRIDAHKFSPLTGSSNDANELTDAGVYLHTGGYGLLNAPRSNYGWILISSHGTSNNHLRGGQIYADYEGVDYRGYDGSTFTEWHSLITKDVVEDIEPIADPSTATVEDVATAFNALLTALKGT